MIASLYIHVPFCAAKCDYCDFFSVPPGPGEMDRYLERLLEELGTELPPGLGVPTIYVGGGTPSLLGAKRLGALLEALGKFRPLELSLEANPESLSRPLLETALEGGVTRLSLGVQSFSAGARCLAGRRGETPDPAEAAALFGPALSLDLMAGLPGQDLGEDIRRALDYGPGHISLYSLTLAEGTPLAARRHILPPQDLADRIWIEGRDLLERAGWAQYEVSNFALPGRESFHNRRYWRMESWLGLGPGASGTIVAGARALRRTRPEDLAGYLAGTLGWEEEALETPALLRESLLMGFRTLEGPCPALFRERFGAEAGALIPETLERWRRRGLVREERCALTGEGLLWLNPFLLEAFAELDRSNK